MWGDGVWGLAEEEAADPTAGGQRGHRSGGGD
jgi:hypothetical protein